MSTKALDRLFICICGHDAESHVEGPCEWCPDCAIFDGTVKKPSLTQWLALTPEEQTTLCAIGVGDAIERGRSSEFWENLAKNIELPT